MSSPQRQFAIDVVRRLVESGHEALWAGGCVRDALLGLTPKDYDVATSATPREVIELFGKKKTVPVGASFGVVMVLGPRRAAGQVEVATFRTDGEYLDGRRPSSVEFCSSEEDARRRDFTINGMFYDPLSDRVIDYVNGRQDLSDRLLRAIGDPIARFTEDKLRMLRAVRFAATYDLTLDQDTADAIRSLRDEIHVVSAERIAQELRRMLAHRSRATAFQMLSEVHLLAILMPTVWGADDSAEYREETASSLDALSLERFEHALVRLLLPEVRWHHSRAERLRKFCRQLRLSKDETNCVSWLAESTETLRGARELPLHVLKPILNDSRSDLLLDLLGAVRGREDDVRFVVTYLQETPTDVLNPDVLISGRDLLELGVPAGPVFNRLLTIIRNEQLDEQLHSVEDAKSRLRELIESEARA